MGPWETDHARLEWVERNYATVHCNFTSPEDWTVTVYDSAFTKFAIYHGHTLRDAIDKARAGNPDEVRDT